MTKLIIVPLEMAGQAPEWLRILPLGKVQLRDGRQPFEVDADSLNAIVNNFKAGGVDLVVDYEHQSLGPDKAPAAGWIKDLEARSDGLYARIDWTAVALQHIEAGEYRYYSPVLKMDPETRRPAALMHAALTNVPAIQGLAPLLAAKYGGEGEPEFVFLRSQAETPAPQQQEEATAMLKQLILKLGLKPEATEAEVLALVETRVLEAVALKAQAEALPEIALDLGLDKTATSAQIKGAVLALKQGQDHLTTLQTEVAALKAENAQAKAAAAVDEAMQAGKLQPSQTEWALEYASRDLEGFKVFVEKSPKIVPVGEAFKISQDRGAGPDGLTPDELAVCKQLNLTPAAFKAQRQAQQEG
jgi:phage I-like protein